MAAKDKYNRVLDELLQQVKQFPDQECLELSTEEERKYIMEHAPRVWHTVLYLDHVLSRANHKNTGFKILDIGPTPFTELYKKYFDVQVSTIDRTSLLEKRCSLNGIAFRKCNLLEEDIPYPDNEFDAVVFTEVFEHLIAPPQIIFRRIRKVLKDKGMLVFSTPNIASGCKRLTLLFGSPILTPAYTVFQEDIDGNWVHGYGHWREYTMGELKDILNRYKFDIIKDKQIIRPYVSLKTVNPLKFMKRLALRALVDNPLSPPEFNLILAQKR